MNSRRYSRHGASLISVALLCGFAGSAARSAESGGKPVDGERIANADAEPGNWLSYGRTYSEQRYSPLKQINDKNAQKLGLAWFADLDTNRAQEATPLLFVVPVQELPLPNPMFKMKANGPLKRKVIV